MNDLLPDVMPWWHELERTAEALLESYGFRELRTPLLERTELFARSIGEVTDIVEKEMYTFCDRNGESVTLRPECTASCVRAALEHGLIQNRVQRLWYSGPMFRYERPQRGRYRQFYQLGAEIFGVPGPEADAELIFLTARLWRRLGLADLRLELNSLGTPASRRAHRTRLVEYLRDHRDALDEDGRRRLESNPLRILDTKNPDLQALAEGAPKLLEHLDDESREHFEALQAVLGAGDVPFVLNPRLVRGLDYYTKTVFEWTTERLGAQGTVCGGGRYDGLVEQIGGPPTPGVGFSMGSERLVELMQQTDRPPPGERPQAYLLAVGEAPARALLPFAERLRDAVPDLPMVVDASPGGFRAKLRRADRSGAHLALILGEDELDQQSLTVKPLRGEGPQVAVAWADLPARVRALLAPGEPPPHET